LDGLQFSELEMTTPESTTGDRSGGYVKLERRGVEEGEEVKRVHPEAQGIGRERERTEQEKEVRRREETEEREEKESRKMYPLSFSTG
jgi:hypothetical protein